MRLAVGTAKYLLFFFNFIFFCTGILIIVVAALTLKNDKEISKHLDAGYQSVPAFLIFVGVLVAIIAFFGCCGAIRNSYCMLMTFAGLLTLIFLFEFGTGIAAYAKKDDVTHAVQKAFDDLMNDYNKNNDTKAAIDDLQQLLKCCGSNGTSDWHEHIPESCCPKLDGKYQHCDKLSKDIFTKSCYDAFKDFIADNIAVIGGIGVGIAFIQILGIVLACCLATAVKDQV